MIWQPAAQEPDPLTELVHEAVRTQLFPGETVGIRLSPVPGENWREALLPDGRVVRVMLNSSPAETTRHGSRSCASMRVTGQLVAGRDGFQVEAEVVVDLATRAVLSNEFRLVPVGTADR
jgi:hypothetical protein